MAAALSGIVDFVAPVDSEHQGNGNGKIIHRLQMISLTVNGRRCDAGLIARIGDRQKLANNVKRTSDEICSLWPITPKKCNREVSKYIDPCRVTHRVEDPP